MIVIADSGTGNLRSLCNALATIGRPHSVAGTPPLEEPEALILPGVGAFGHAAAALAERGWPAYVRDLASRGTRIVGICLGMQLFFASSEESPGARGLGLVAGTVRRLRGGAKVPHIGWSALRYEGTATGPRHAYFVHSYVCVPDDPRVVEGRARHGEDFAAVVRHGSIVGVQFHPEKSAAGGVAYLAEILS
ncbi:MAG: imidazole glycerol phosphate synthase subunit HisH [Acidobacteriota bacterium]